MDLKLKIYFLIEWLVYYEQLENSLSADLKITTTELSFFPIITSLKSGEIYKTSLAPKEAIQSELTYEILNAPSGTSINSTGILNWQTASATTESFEVKIHNQLDIEQTLSWSVTVSDDGPTYYDNNQGSIRVSSVAQIGESSYENFIVKKVLNATTDFDANAKPTAPLLYPVTGTETHDHGIYEIRFDLRMNNYIGQIPVDLWIKKSESSIFKKISSTNCFIPGQNEWAAQKIYWLSKQVFADGQGENWSSEDITAPFGNQVELKITLSQTSQN